ncbi:DnaA N-terminal domain-containing protein [Desulfosporosinus hippei]|uniref:DnaA N-terminal domain-containing protein n=1 Tax=Desulfosporosinus hippei DSM 8344 TaxID=1121419 RepID=A0A1G8L409_9FIRM|nr:DnaA N-terminal domain-containing protein [Desulfosporosinus hippei]SDI50408.1 DnaA N-terminal domain-containing protein [Desulfosporosinus hippei DSM 8344]
MRTEVIRDYENKVFPKGHIKQFAFNLAQFDNMLPSVPCIHLTYNDDGFETSTIVSPDDLENICEVVPPLNSIGFNYDSIIINIRLLRHSKNLSIMYVISGDTERVKKLIIFVENTLELTSLNEEEISELTIDNNEIIEQTQMDTDHSNSKESTNSVGIIWKKALIQLQSLYSTESYHTWIAPLVPSVDGNQLLLNCPNRFVIDWIESRYKKQILQVIQSIEPSIMEVCIRVHGNQDDESDINKHQELIKKIQGKTIDHIVANKNSNSGFDIVFTDGTVLELYVDKLDWVFDENPND